MTYLEAYLKTIAGRGNVKLAETVKKTAEDIGLGYIKNFSFVSHELGLLFGNVQSGKTCQMFGVICEATDLGFPVFVLLTTDNVVLQQQTLERVKADLPEYCICGENDDSIFCQNELVQPTIIVIKKNVSVLRKWSNVFGSTGFMRGNPLFIVDDEADAASLNTLVNRGKQSSINRYLDKIKNESSSSIYLQVTGTPQALYLQTRASGWQPLFTYYFRPGEGYLGGDFFFPKGRKGDCIEFLESSELPARDVIIHHLAVAAQISASGGRVSNCLVHPSVRQAAHDSYARDIQNEIDWCTDNLNGEFKSALFSEYSTLQPRKNEKCAFETVFAEASAMLRHSAIRIFIMNGKNDVKSEYYSTGFNIIVGGNTLGRGVTFPGLHTIYYTRASKKPQADTMWQHSRMFGYDRDPGLMKVFIDEHLYKLFSDINATNNALIAQIEQGTEKVKIFYASGLSPTRKNVIDNKHVLTYSGGTNYYPFDPENDSIEELDTLLAPFSDETQSYKTSLRIVKEILSHIISGPDFNVASYISFLDMFLSKNPAAQGYLIVRRNRNIARGTGAMLSPNDLQLGMAITDYVVMTIYKVTGEKGWDNRQIWIPNIKLPDDGVYYDVEDDAVDE